MGINKETDNYKLYLQQLIDLKSQQRSKELETKKNKKKEKDKKEMIKIALPPRMWTVERTQRGGTTVGRLLYPMPKVKQDKTEKTKDPNTTTKGKDDKEKSTETPKDKSDDENVAETEDNNEENEDDID